jgi:hypothetical protein
MRMGFLAMRYHLTSVRVVIIKTHTQIKASKHVEKENSLNCWECKLRQSYGNQYGGFSKT